MRYFSNACFTTKTCNSYSVFKYLSRLLMSKIKSSSLLKLFTLWHNLLKYHLNILIKYSNQWKSVWDEIYPLSSCLIIFRHKKMSKTKLKVKTSLFNLRHAFSRFLYRDKNYNSSVKKFSCCSLNCFSYLGTFSKELYIDSIRRL